MKEVDLLLEAEIASRFYSKIRLAIEKQELEQKKKVMYGIEWPRSLILRKRIGDSQFRNKKMNIDTKLRCFDIYAVSKNKYNEMRKSNTKLDYSRFNNLRNYFVVKRLQTLTEEQNKKLKINFAVQETELDRKIERHINDETVKELRLMEDGEWVFSGEEDFKTKIPAYYGPLIFIKLELFKEHSLSIINRQHVDSSKHTDKRSISTRFVIPKNQRSRYAKITEVTYSNLRKLINDLELLEKCKKYLRRYNKVKEGI